MNEQVGVTLLLSFVFVDAAFADDLPIGHLTETAYGDWTATGDAFKYGPASGEDWMRKLEIENDGGNAVISSEKVADGQNDRPQGTLTSPEFKSLTIYPLKSAWPAEVAR
ncbi:MAG TPA: hypothetical protein VG938_09830 [Verrucomicrobiae bacterium]|nr:hypothetical protein [Verrucomicrobiae bacterium]